MGQTPTKPLSPGAAVGGGGGSPTRGSPGYTYDSAMNRQQQHQQQHQHQQQQPPIPTMFRWLYGGRRVFIIGTFNQWSQKIPMNYNSEDNSFVVILNIPPGRHEYRFVVDGEERCDPNQPRSPNNERNNMITVAAGSSTGSRSMASPSSPSSSTPATTIITSAQQHQHHGGDSRAAQYQYHQGGGVSPTSPHSHQHPYGDIIEEEYDYEVSRSGGSGGGGGAGSVGSVGVGGGRRGVGGTGDYMDESSGYTPRSQAHPYGHQQQGSYGKYQRPSSRYSGGGSGSGGGAGSYMQDVEVPSPTSLPPVGAAAAAAATGGHRQVGFSNNINIHLPHGSPAGGQASGSVVSSVTSATATASSVSPSSAAQHGRPPAATSAATAAAAASHSHHSRTISQYSDDGIAAEKYGQEERTFVENKKTPPLLPPHLRYTPLNTNTRNASDPSIMPMPLHVSINHSYFSSSQDGVVMMVGITQRYRDKYSTMCLYKPRPTGEQRHALEQQLQQQQSTWSSMLQQQQSSSDAATSPSSPPPPHVNNQDGTGGAVSGGADLSPSTATSTTASTTDRDGDVAMRREH